MRYLIVLVLLFENSYVIAQDYIDQKYDRQIIVTDILTTGCSNIDTSDKIYRVGTLFDFNSEELKMSVLDTNRGDGQPLKYWVKTNASQIANKEGKLTAFFNGRGLWDRNANFIELPVFGSFLPNPYYSINGYSNSLILPIPSKENTYILLSVNNHKFDSIYFANPAETVTIVQFEEQSDGSLNIISENREFYNSKFTYFGAMSACRHANGRDWWVIMPYRHKDAFHIFLLDNEGIRWHHNQQMSSTILDDSFFPTFSPDGRYYTRVEFEHKTSGDIDHAQIFPFDRCFGTFSEPYSFDLPGVDSAGITQLMFDQTSRYIYAMRGWSLWQGDIKSTDIATSFIEVLHFNPNIKEAYGNFSGFGAGLLAPDGKIYTFDGRNTFGMSVINHPDRPGLACDARYVQIYKPSCTGSSLGNQPNFNLGPIDGSHCDTLGLDNILNTHNPTDPISKLGIYPNPNSGTFTALVPSQQGQLEVIGTSGEVISRYQISAFQMEVQLDCTQGVHFVRYISEDGSIIAVSRVVVLK